jgi:hypothetical protein
VWVLVAVGLELVEGSLVAALELVKGSLVAAPAAGWCRVFLEQLPPVPTMGPERREPQSELVIRG